MNCGLSLLFRKFLVYWLLIKVFRSRTEIIFLIIKRLRIEERIVGGLTNVNTPAQPVFWTVSCYQFYLTALVGSNWTI